MRHALLRLSVSLVCLCAVTSLSAWNIGKRDSIRIESIISSMTLEQKVCQMFVVRVEAMTDSLTRCGRGFAESHAVTALDERMRAFYRRFPVGGFCLFSHNVVTPAQTKSFTSALHSLPGYPLLCVDEEGGRVARLAGNPAFNLPATPSAASLAAGRRPEQVYEAALSIGTYLKEHGFDVDFAPVADVNTNPSNVVIGDRAFSDNPAVARKMVNAFLEGLEAAGVTGCLKHFPGHGDVTGDTHVGSAVAHKTWEEMLSCEMVPFASGIRAGASMIMTAHILAPEVTLDSLPSTLSPVMLSGKLRGELGFRGIIVTDAMEMSAISDSYGSGESAVASIVAGADIVLMPENLIGAVCAVVAEVHRGTIPESRIDDSLRRILALKCQKSQKYLLE